MKNIFSKVNWPALGQLLIATVVLMAAAFHNGYPLVYSDTGTYVNSGFEGTIPMDRPIVYGLFIRHMSLSDSLWGPVLVQCFLLAWLLRLLVQPLFSQHFFGKYLLLVVTLCMLTPLPWYTGQLMPDIFTAFQILILGIVLTRQDLSRSLWISLGGLFVLCCLVHFSNLFIGLFAIGGLAVWLWLKPAARAGFPQWRRRIMLVACWSVLAFVALPTVNWLMQREFVLGKGSYTFIIGRMVDSGMLKMYLDDYCAERNYRLCQYKDSLPTTSRKFHWDGESPLYKEGGWGAPEAEYRSIVWGTLTSPKYLALHVWESALSTPTQLMQNAIGSGLDYGWYRSPESPPYQVVQRYFPEELNEYRASRQCGNLWGQNLDFTFLNILNFWVLCATMLGLIYLVFLKKNEQTVALLPLLWVIVAGLIANAFITSSLAVICDRFSPRVVWLLSFWVLTVLIQSIDNQDVKS